MLKPMEEPLKRKYLHLLDLLKPMRQAAVAFSGGVDSTLVLKLAMNALGAENVVAVTGVSPSLPQRELQSVRELAAAMHAKLDLIDTAEVDDPRYIQNAPSRCYFCKSELYTKLNQYAKQHGLDAILNGVITDDTSDLRPGVQAAKEYGIRSILLEAGMTKADVRALAEHLGVPNWAKPALACLSSRIPYGTPVTIARLRQVELAEAVLYGLGFTNFRVRHHEKLARIEAMPQDLPKLLAEPMRSRVIEQLKQIGYTYITVDLQGFRSGSSNESIIRPDDVATK